MERLTESELQAYVKEYESLKERLAWLDGKISFELNIRLTERQRKGPIERVKAASKPVSKREPKRARWMDVLGI